ncbi:MAG: hypothetical protein Q8J93_05850 [Xanthomonadales bacterium]|nr:hypothetical protein [Xanthomonadales bacterium]
MFRVDAKSSHSQRLREEIAIEWKLILERKADHQIFWEFLRRERDNIIHDYNWRAYEAWMKPDGTFGATSLSLLSLGEDQARRVILMKSGHFKGRNSLELLNESADWVETRIFGAIRRAGYNPEEERGLFHFQPKPTLADSILRNEIPTLISSAIAD